MSAGHPPVIVVQPSSKAQTLVLDSDPQRLVAACILHKADPLPAAVLGIAAGLQFGAASDDLLLLAAEVPQ